MSTALPQTASRERSRAFEGGLVTGGSADVHVNRSGRHDCLVWRWHPAGGPGSAPHGIDVSLSRRSVAGMSWTPGDQFDQSALVMDFPGYLRRRVIDGLRSLDAAQRADTFAVSLFTYDEQDDPRFPTLTVGTNTERQVRMHDEDGEDPEVRWNYAYWLQDRLAVVGDAATDPAGAELRRSWLESEGLWFDDDDDGSWPFAGLSLDEMVKWYSSERVETVEDSAPKADGQDATPRSDVDDLRITKSFVDLCVRTVQELHTSGLIEELFGRPIPVVVHELEYYDEIARQNIEANGPDLVSGLVEWIASMYAELDDED